MKRIFLQVLLLLVLAATTHAFSLSPLPQTGQNSCWNTDGGSIPCAGTGQDGENQKGYPWPNPRFKDNGNGTVTDNLTGLIWLKNANCFGNQVWATAVSSSRSLANGQCSLTDGSSAGQWRLPSRNELESLVNQQQVNSVTWLNAQDFFNVQAYGYWSSSSYAVSTSYAWGVRMSVGNVGYASKASLNYVWPVRAGQ